MKKQSKFRGYLSAVVVAAGLLGAPTSSQAWGCYACGYVQAYIQVNAAAIGTFISDNLKTMTEQFTQTATILAEKIYQGKMASNTMESSTSSTVGANDKLIHALGQLEQAAVNYQTADFVTATNARAQEMYSAPQSEGFQTCAYQARAEQAGGALQMARNEAKARSILNHRRNMEAVNGNDEAIAVYSNYAQAYCSEEAAKAGIKDPATGKVCTPVAPEMQDAGLRGDVFLSPTASATYSAEEAKAAADFIVMVSNPVPTELMPVAQEKSSGGDRAQLAMMNGNAKLSLVQYAMEQSRAAKVAAESGMPNAAKYTGSLSVTGLIQRFVQERFGNEKYTETLDAKINEYGLYKELNLQLAFSNWLEVQNYRRNMTIEASVAADVAAMAKASSRRQTVLQQSLVSSR